MNHAAHAMRQLLLDPTDDKRRRIDQATDQARGCFGESVIRPAILAAGAHDQR